jgi:hypothetical protein
MEPIEWLIIGGAVLFGGLGIDAAASGIGNGVQRATNGLTNAAVVLGALYLGYLALRK